MKRMVYGFLCFLGVLLGIALIVPFFLNLNDYKPQIQAEAKKAIGRDVLIDGDLSLSFLPSPQLTLHKVRIVNISGGGPQDFLNVKQLRIAVSLWPLLKKHLKVKSLELDQPEIFLEKLKNGQTNWTFPNLSTSSTSSSSSIPSSPNFEVDFEKAKITNGRVIYLANGQEIKVQNINTHATMASLKGPYSLEGTLSAYDRDVKVKCDFGTSTDPEHVTLKIQVDEATSIFDGKLSLSSLTFKGNLKAEANPRMFKDLSFNDKTSPLFTDVLRMNADVVANINGLSLNDAKFDIGSAHPTGDLKVLLKNGLNVEGALNSLPGQTQATFTLAPSDQGLKGIIKATVPQGKELLNWLRVDTESIPPKMLQALTLSTGYTIGEAINLKGLILMIGGAKLQGDASWQSQKSGHSMVVDLETPRIENILKLLGSKDPKPLGASKLKGKIQVGATSLHLTSLKGHLGKNLSFEGDIAVDHKKTKPHVQATLVVNSINLDTLLASRITQDSLFAEGKVFLVGAKQKPGSSHSGPKWSHTPLDFGFLHKFDGQFDITSSQLTQKDIVVTHPKLVAKIQNGRLDIASLTGSIYGGMFRGSGHLTADNTMHFHILLQDAHLKQLFSKGSNIKIVSGKLTLSSDLSTHGNNMAEMVGHLAGPLNITAKDGVINGFDLHAISQRLGNLQNLQSILGLLNTSMERGQTPFSSFKADIAFTEGVGRIQSMNLIAQGGQGQASGQIDLPRYTVDIRSEFHLTDHPKLPAFHMRLLGPIDNPTRQLDTDAFQEHLVENVFKGVVENLGKGKFKPADMLGSLLGGKNGKEGQPAPQQQQDKAAPLDKPEKIVKDIFKGLF
jgi:AsmA protein